MRCGVLQVRCTMLQCVAIKKKKDTALVVFDRSGGGLCAVADLFVCCSVL